MNARGRAHNLGERIRAARRMAGQTQRQLADGAGVSAMAISKYETGKMAPGSAVLLRLAKALGVRVEFFLRPDSVTLEAVRFRRHQKLPAADLRRAEAKASEWLERLQEAEALADAHLEGRFTLLNKWHVSDPEGVEDCAAKLRAEWGLGDGVIGSFIDLFERHGLRVGSAELPGGVDALVFQTQTGDPVIVVRNGIPGDRQRFTFAHDLGHLVFNCPESLDREKMCHRFAAALLVPAVTARRELGEKRDDLSLLELYDLKHKHGMSMSAWVKRAGELGIVSQAYVARVRKRFREKGWDKVEPGEQVQPEYPGRLDRLVVRLVEEEVIGTTRAGELLGESWGTFVKKRSEDSKGLPVAVDF